MNSFVFNSGGEQVIRLEYTGIIERIDDTGNLIAAYSPTFNLDLKRIYNIKRFKATLGYFKSLIPANIMFPNPENFYLDLKISADLADINGNGVVHLFDHLSMVFTNGWPYEKVFEEPFIFTTGSDLANKLYFVISDNGSIISSLSLPKPAGGNFIDIYANLIFEGTSVPDTGVANQPDQNIQPGDQYDTPEIPDL